MEKLQSLFGAAKCQIKRAAAPVVGTGLAFVGSVAHAAYTPPTAATAAWTEMGEAWDWVETNMWTVAVPIVVGFFILKLFKKGSNKVS